jgi:adenylate kinase family enzyme
MLIKGDYMKNKIHIFGASGSGTTTLAKMLCKE